MSWGGDNWDDAVEVERLIDAERKEREERGLDDEGYKVSSAHLCPRWCTVDSDRALPPRCDGGYIRRIPRCAPEKGVQRARLFPSLLS